MQRPMIERFEEGCGEVGIKPADVLRAARIHPSLWWKWKSGGVSPTLRNFEAAVAKLEEMGGRTCDCGQRRAPRRSKVA